MEFLPIVAIGAFLYFIMIRPQQKRAKAHQATISALAPGVRVLLNSGVFATVRHLGEAQAIVELAPGVEVTILKATIGRPARPDEEEFEFSDDADQGLSAEVMADEVLLPEDAEFENLESDTVVPTDTDSVVEPDVTFDPRSDGDISAEELQRRFDN